MVTDNGTQRCNQFQKREVATERDELRTYAKQRERAKKRASHLGSDAKVRERQCDAEPEQEDDKTNRMRGDRGNERLRFGAREALSLSERMRKRIVREAIEETRN